MKTFKIVINELSVRAVEVQAQNKVEALKKIKEMYESCDIVLDWNDFDSVNFNIISEKEE